MTLTVQKRLAASVMGCSKNRVWLDENRLDEIKEAITKADIRSLVSKGLIQEKPMKITSRGRARQKQIQKRKGRQKGHGSRKGRSTARLGRKEKWINTIRLQRMFLKMLRDKKAITPKIYKMLYMKSKGGFFRSKRHIKLYIEENKLAKGEK